MKLIDHIKETKFSKTVYANEAGISRPTLYRALNGKKLTLDIAKKIVDYSKGLVSYEDLVGETAE